MNTTLRAAMVMAGGRSERMRADGHETHKGLRTVQGLPLMEWNIRALLAHGFRDIYISVAANEVGLENWISERATQLDGDDVTLTTVSERTPLGTIGAAGRLPAHVGDVLIVNVDNLTDLDLRALADFHQATGACATIASHDESFRIPFGRLGLDGDRVTGYSEKPEIPVPISSGTYVLSRNAMAAIPLDRRYDVPILIERLLVRGHGVRAYRHTASWIDVNDEASLAMAETLVSSPHWRPAAQWSAAHA